jgi:hypothetical protein
MFNMSRQITRRKVRLNELMESRILGDGYVRFGGRFRETYYSNVVQGARSRAYFLTTSHDGSGSITAAFTPIRIVCANTLNAALHNCSNSIKIRHTSGAKERLEQAHRVMGITNTLSIQMEAIFNQWAKVCITDKEVKKLIQAALVPNKEVLRNLQEGKEDELSTCFLNMCDNAYEYAFSNPTQLIDTTKGTLFGAYNSVTGYFQNVRNYKNDEAKVKSLLLGGTGQLRTQAAFNLCADFARNGVNALQLN